MQSLLSGFRPYLLLTLLCVVTYLPGQASLPAMDRDEARFMQATRQMVESDDYVVVRFQDELRAKKPVGIYWLQAAAVSLLSHPAKTEPWPYRLPSLLAAVAAVLLTFRIASALFDRRIALVSAGVLATALMTTVEAHLAKTDAVLLALTVAVQGCFALIYMQGKGGQRAPSWAPLAFWLALGASILVKGPVTPIIFLLTALALGIADRSWAWITAMRPVMGIILVAAVVTPWFAAVSEQTGGTFIGKAVSEDLLPKLLGGQESHGALPGYYLLLATATLWPGSLFLWPAVWRSWRERALPGLRFALAWAVPAWVMFELVPTKLPHYTLPLYPALAMMIGAALFAVRDGTYDMLSGLPAKAWYALWSLIGVALAIAAVMLPLHYGSGFSVWSIPAALGALAAVALPWVNLLRRRFLNALGWAMGGAVVAYVSVFAGVMPALDALWVSPRLIAATDSLAPGAPVAVTGYHEPSLVFEKGTALALVGPQQAADFLREHADGVVAVEARDLDAFRAAAPAVIEGDTVSGFNYSRGKPVTLHLFQAAP